MHRPFRPSFGIILCIALSSVCCDDPLGGNGAPPPQNGNGAPPPPGGGGGIEPTRYEASLTVSGQLGTWQTVTCDAEGSRAQYYEWSYKSAAENDDQYHTVDSINNFLPLCFTEAGRYTVRLEVAPGVFATRELEIAESPAPSQEPDLRLRFAEVSENAYAASLITSDNLLRSFRCESPTGDALAGISIRFETHLLDRMYYYIYLWKPAIPGDPIGFYERPAASYTPHVEFITVNETIEPEDFPIETPLSGTFALDDIRKIGKVSSSTNLKYGNRNLWQRFGESGAGFLVVTDDARFEGMTIPIPLTWDNLAD